MLDMSFPTEDRIIENYFTQTPFEQLVMYPTLAPDLVPAALRENLGISASSGDTPANKQLAKCSGTTFKKLCIHGVRHCL
jgi:hypothetical protein